MFQCLIYFQHLLALQSADRKWKTSVPWVSKCTKYNRLMWFGQIKIYNNEEQSSLMETEKTTAP